MPTPGKHWLGQHPVLLQLLLALLALLIGTLVYVFDRNPEATYFLPEVLSLKGQSAFSFGWIGNHLPDLLHVYAFILLSSAVLRPDRRGMLHISITWLLLESLFEIGQHASLSPHIAANLPQWFLQVPLLDNTAAYFRQGRFDPFDLLAVVIGTLAAYLSLLWMPPYPRPQDN